MARKHRAKLRIFLFGIMLIFLSACASQEPQETGTGIGGYVYLPRRLTTSPDGGYWLPEQFDDLCVSGDFLYYSCIEGRSVCVRQTAFPGDGGMADLTGAETVFSVWNGSFTIEGDGIYAEEEILEQLDLALDTASAESPESESGDSTTLVEPGKTYVGFFLQKYAVDEEQNVYLFLDFSMGSCFQMETQGYLVCKKSAEGEWLYRRYHPGMKYPLALTADGTGGLYLLTEEGIFAIGGDGEKHGIPGSNQEMSIGYGRFFGEQEGPVCLVWEDASNPDHWNVTEFLKEGSIRLRELETPPGYAGPDIISRGYFLSDGKIIFTAYNSGDLCTYDIRTSERNPILHWRESLLIESCISTLVAAKPDTFLVLYEEPGEEGLYLLEKTAVSELPVKMKIVIADLESTKELRNTVTRFNRWNEEYNVVIEDYGYAGSETESAALRRDAALLSSDPPQLLDLGGRELDRDMEKGLLEDLYPYLERSTVLSREDFLENVLEGYTIDGKLAGIPISFRAEMVSGRPSELDAVHSWTMEDVYALTEQYPDCKLLGDGSKQSGTDRYYEMNTWEHLLESFCVDYYMEEFIDWEEGVCRFDCEDFRKLLLWVGEHGKEKIVRKSGETVYYTPGRLPEDTLLYEESIDFDSAAELEYMFEGLGGLALPRFLGYPTADGKGTIHLSPGSQLGIVAGADHKEGAWEFLEFYLQQDNCEGFYRAMPARKAALQDIMEDAVAYRYTEYGSSIAKTHPIIDGQIIHIYATPRELAEELMTYIREADFRYRSNRRSRIVNIVTEEAVDYYQGVRSLDEAVGIIQNRVQLLLNE